MPLTHLVTAKCCEVLKAQAFIQVKWPFVALWNKTDFRCDQSFFFYCHLLVYKFAVYVIACTISTSFIFRSFYGNLFLNFEVTRARPPIFREIVCIWVTVVGDAMLLYIWWVSAMRLIHNNVLFDFWFIWWILVATKSDGFVFNCEGVTFASVLYCFARWCSVLWTELDHPVILLWMVSLVEVPIVKSNSALS